MVYKARKFGYILYLSFFPFSFVLYEISLETNLEYSGKLRLA